MLKFGKIANGLDTVEEAAAYSNKVDDILRESIIIGKSNKVSKGAEVIKVPFEIPAGGVAGDNMGAMLKGAAEARKLPGVVTGGDNLSDVSKMMRGSNGNAGVIPKEIADNLSGKSFNNFDEFRGAFWEEVGNSKYVNEFGASNITRMQDGLAPIAQKSQQYGKIKSYVLHHMDPIYNGGGVYDLDNLKIVTPRFHQEILDKGFHFNK